MQNETYSFRDFSDDTKREKNGNHFPDFLDGEEEQYEEEEREHLTDEMDHEILMHRDAHFAGDFTVMLDYYLSDHIGVNPDFDLERIKYLAEVEKELDRNLAPMLLTGAEAEQVAAARAAYRQLKSIYEIEDPKAEIPRLIADLILSEEEEPEEEIEAVVAKGKAIVPSLLQIVKNEESYDPLFPGYGYAPYLAILCLGRIKDPSVIIPLFETLGRDTLFGEDVIIEAFAEIGNPAKRFLLKAIGARPLTRDNVNAAFALSAFPLDEEVAIAAFEQLKDPEVREKPLLSLYLLCLCDALKNTPQREEFFKLAQDPSCPKELKNEMSKMLQDWNEREHKA